MTGNAPQPKRNEASVPVEPEPRSVRAHLHDLTLRTTSADACQSVLMVEAMTVDEQIGKLERWLPVAADGGEWHELCTRLASLLECCRDGIPCRR